MYYLYKGVRSFFSLFRDVLSVKRIDSLDSLASIRLSTEN